MATIDKNMYERLKSWSDFDEEIRPHNQRIMYVNSRDRALTGATIRKMMYEMTEEDVEGELYIAYYSAKNFYHNMRDYYTEISRLYMHEPKGDEPLVEVIKDYPPTCGWLYLIIEDLETLTDDTEKMQELMETVIAFSVRNSSVILVGNGDYKDVFSGCDYALKEISDGLAAEKDSNLLMVGYYEQEKAPLEDKVVYKTTDDLRDELDYYWHLLYEQLEHKYFDYEGFKSLCRETMEYLLPRVSKEKVYRKDLYLIERLGNMWRKDSKDVEGCSPWEFDAARKVSCGLHKEIVNLCGHNTDFSNGEIGIDVAIEEPKEDYGVIHISGSFYTYVDLRPDTVCNELDELSEEILECTYKGDRSKIWKALKVKNNKGEKAQISEDEMEKIGQKMNSLMADIKKVADKTVNKEPGRKVRRYKANGSENNA